MSILDLDSDVLERDGDELLLNEQAKEIFGDRAYVVRELGRWIAKSMEFHDQLIIDMENETVKDFFDKISYIYVDAAAVNFHVDDTLYCRKIPYWKGRIVCAVRIVGDKKSPAVVGDIKDRLEFKDVVVSIWKSSDLYKQNP